MLNCNLLQIVLRAATLQATPVIRLLCFDRGLLILSQVAHNELLSRPSIPSLMPTP